MKTTHSLNRYLGLASMVALAALVPVAQAGIVNSQYLDTSAPPASGNGYILGAFPAVGGAPSGTQMDSSFPGAHGAVGFSSTMELFSVPGDWQTWGHGFSGNVYGTASSPMTLTLPSQTGAFYLYAAPDSGSANFSITAYDNNGDFVTRSLTGVNYDAAQGYAFFADPSETLDHLFITSDSPYYALGEFGTSVPEPGQVAMGGFMLLGMGGMAVRRMIKRK